MERRLIPGHSPMEPVFGFSRAVVSGRNVHVAGTAPIPREGEPPEGAYEQMRLCLDLVGEALGKAGAGFEDVVRTRMFIVDPADWRRSPAPRRGLRRDPPGRDRGRGAAARPALAGRARGRRGAAVRLAALTGLYVGIVCSAQVGAQKIVELPWAETPRPAARR